MSSLADAVLAAKLDEYAEIMRIARRADDSTNSSEESLSLQRVELQLRIDVYEAGLHELKLRMGHLWEALAEVDDG